MVRIPGSPAEVWHSANPCYHHTCFPRVPWRQRLTEYIFSSKYIFVPGFSSLVPTHECTVSGFIPGTSKTSGSHPVSCIMDTGERLHVLPPKHATSSPLHLCTSSAVFNLNIGITLPLYSRNTQLLNRGVECRRTDWIVVRCAAVRRVVPL